jgi:hypothetical protein
MSCDICTDLDRQIASARDRRESATTEEEIHNADEQELDLVLQMISHLAACPNTTRKPPSTERQ